MNGFVLDDFFQQLGGRVPGDLVQLEKARVEPRSEQMVQIGIQCPEIGVGEEATPSVLPSAIGLVWRALILWVILLAVVGLAAWVGV